MGKKQLMVLWMTFLVSILNADTPIGKQNDTSRKIKLDVISVYNTFFDIRRQMRMGIEYQRPLRLKGKWSKKQLFHTFHLDMGQFDHYTYIKYHDFFNSQGGFYAVENDVRTFGGHFLYAVKYNISRAANKKLRYFYCNVIDIQMFKKHILTKDESTNQKSNDNYKQLRIGYGHEYGLEIPIHKRLSVEFKAAAFVGLWTLKSRTDSPLIKPYKALWYDTEQRFWFIPRLNICYAF